MSQFLVGILIIAVGGVLVWFGQHLATEGWKKWRQPHTNLTQPIHEEQENLLPPPQTKELPSSPNVSQTFHAKSTPQKEVLAAVFESRTVSSVLYYVLGYSDDGESLPTFSYYSDTVRSSDMIYASAASRYKKSIVKLAFSDIKSIIFGKINENVPEYVHVRIVQRNGSILDAYAKKEGLFRCTTETCRPEEIPEEIKVIKLREITFEKAKKIMPSSKNTRNIDWQGFPAKISIRNGKVFHCNIIKFFGRGKSEITFKYNSEAVKTGLMTPLSQAQRYERSLREIYLEELASVSFGDTHKEIQDYIETSIILRNGDVGTGYVRASDGFECISGSGSKRINVGEISQGQFLWNQ